MIQQGFSMQSLQMPAPHTGTAMPPAGASENRPIDLVHLARQSLGDRELERELLELFDRQAARIAAEINMPDLSGNCAAERRDLAHTLKGSARAVGAWHVASMAQAYEKTIERDGHCRNAGMAAIAVRDAVREARNMIAAILERV